MKKLKKIEVLKSFIEENLEVFRCPICKGSIKNVTENSVICKNNHCFNMSKKGYINLIKNNNKTIYDKDLFEARSKIYDQKVYEILSEEIINIVDKYTTGEKINYVLDAGCGEGYYLNQLYLDEKINKKCRLIGIDIAREGVALATRFENRVFWSVSDLSNLPFDDNKIDVILDILSPSNYREFARVLNKKGIIIKVIPEENYLQEIRNQIAAYIKKDKYSNKNIVDVFESNLDIVYEKRITYKVKDFNLEDFIKMTPLTSSLTQNQIDELVKSGINSITIDLKVVVGREKDN
ncbi:methyltransferase domain-containing protein [Intestinibacter sp.]|uniref:methyltransferase domain-containing protein n=1 Tax=Intestinibacter sp. TaxID=1965304 RepID=UPI0025B9D117|nr:methyltransferase domain-containing protein [Intestinibacter sp.]MCI6738642.1 methyltransferase domain-containing protein [Intestinibacter sp.]MDY2735529.1 methyltransferase domain-containing protein [Intestinibacter sp.]